jgi:hypothetical protein
MSVLITPNPEIFLSLHQDKTVRVNKTTKHNHDSGFCLETAKLYFIPFPVWERGREIRVKRQMQMREEGEKRCWCGGGGQRGVPNKKPTTTTNQSYQGCYISKTEQNTTRGKTRKDKASKNKPSQDKINPPAC